MKPGLNIRLKGLKARTEALEQAASLDRPNGMAALQEESPEVAVRQPSFEDIMNALQVRVRVLHRLFLTRMMLIGC